jgi:hypothetical protein
MCLKTPLIIYKHVSTNMTQTQIEILIIIIDKGLLALVIVLIGYFYNRRLENQKVNYNKQLIYETERIKSLIKLGTQSQYLSQSSNVLLSCLSLLSSESNTEESWNKIKDFTNKYNSEREKFFDLLNETSMFVEVEFMDKITAFLDSVEEVFRIIKSQDLLIEFSKKDQNQIEKLTTDSTIKMRVLTDLIKERINQKI